MISPELFKSAEESKLLPQVEAVASVIGQDRLEPLDWQSSLYAWEQRWLTAKSRLWEQSFRRQLGGGVLNWELALWGVGNVLLKGGERDLAIGAELIASLPAETSRLRELVNRRNLAEERGEVGEEVGYLGEVVGELAGALQTRIEQAIDPVWKALTASQSWEIMRGVDEERLLRETVGELLSVLPVRMDLAKLDAKGGWDQQGKTYQLRAQDIGWLGAVVERVGRLGRPDVVAELESYLAKGIRRAGWRDLSMASSSLFDIGVRAQGELGEVVSEWASEMEREPKKLPIHLHGQLVRRAAFAGEWEKVWQLVAEVDNIEVGLWQNLLGEALATGEERQLTVIWQQMQRMFPYPNLRVIGDWWLSWGVAAGNSYYRHREGSIAILRRPEVSELVSEGMIDFALEGVIEGLAGNGPAELAELTATVCRRVSERVSEGGVSRFESAERLRHLVRLKQISQMDRQLDRPDMVGREMERIWNVAESN